MKQRLHPIELTLMIVAALALTSGAVALHTQSQLAEKVVRLHVLANSDSEEDQALKLKVRDAVLEQATETLRGADSQAEASRRLTDILPELEETARAVITANGYDYGVRAELAETSFPTKEYDGFALPAGEYLALRVLIGEAAGQNWWCVVFPPLCLGLGHRDHGGDCGFRRASARTRFPSSPAENEGYVVKFKAIELWDRFCAWWKTDEQLQQRRSIAPPRLFAL